MVEISTKQRFQGPVQRESGSPIPQASTEVVGIPPGLVPQTIQLGFKGRCIPVTSGMMAARLARTEVGRGKAGLVQNL